MSSEQGNNRPIDAIERSVVLQTHRDVPEQLEREKVVIAHRGLVTDMEAGTLKQLGDYRMRYNPAGQIFIDRFRKTGIQVGLSDVPKNVDLGFDSLEVVEMLWPTIPDIETGIRYTKHIADEYDKKNGQQTLVIHSLHDVIRFVGRELQKPKSERLPWQQLEESFAHAIVKAGLDKSQDVSKLEMGIAMMEAIKRDSIGRENSARTRLMLAQLYPKLTKMLLRNEPKYNKYRYLESVLYQERAKDRSPLEELVGQTSHLEQMSPRDHQKKLLVDNIREHSYYNLKPGKMRVAPYVQIAAVARYLQFGKNTVEEEKKLKEYIGEELTREVVAARTYYDITEEGDRVDRLVYIGDYVKRSLQDADTHLPGNQAAA